MNRKVKIAIFLATFLLSSAVMFKARMHCMHHHGQQPPAHCMMHSDCNTGPSGQPVQK